MTSVTDVVVTDTSETSELTIAKLELIPSRRDWAVTGLVTLVALCLGVSSPALADPKPKIKFDMMRSAGGHKCQLRRGRNRKSENHLAGAGRGDGRGGERTSAEYRVRLLCDPAPQRPIRVSLVSG
jgi:hypothetical protein